ncbi:MAG: permease [Methanosarcinaceae archaeon]
MSGKGNGSGWYFLLAVICLYLLAAVLDPKKTVSAIGTFADISMRILPALILMFVFMALINYYVNAKKLSATMGKDAGLKKWIITIVAGLISSGPIYIWYPVLGDLHEKGVGYGLIATFLYNRSVKIPFLPILASYFGLTYVICLITVTVGISVVQGLMIDRLMPEGEEEMDGI